MESPQEITGLGQAHQTVLRAIREQHPEWVEKDGRCPSCEAYEHKLAELLVHFAPEESAEVLAAK